MFRKNICNPTGGSTSRQKSFLLGGIEGVVYKTLKILVGIYGPRVVHFIPEVVANRD